MKEDLEMLVKKGWNVEVSYRQGTFFVNCLEAVLHEDPKDFRISSLDLDDALESCCYQVLAHLKKTKP